MQEGKIVSWPRAIGDRVRKGEVVVVIEADKSEVEAAVAGVVRHYYVHAGDTVRCGALLGILTETAGEAFDPVAFEVDETTGV